MRALPSIKASLQPRDTSTGQLNKPPADFPGIFRLSMMRKATVDMDADQQGTDMDSNQQGTSRALPIMPPESSSGFRTPLGSESRPASMLPTYTGPSHITPYLIQAPNFIREKSLQIVSTRPPLHLWFNARTTSLHQAIQAANVELVRDHLEEGASVDLRDGAGMTPLILACSLPIPPTADLLDLLLRRGAHPNVTDKNAWTPLLHAVHQGHSQAVDTLLQHGADVTARTKTGATALHLADDELVAQSLLRAGADANALDWCNQSPLLLALPRGNLAMIRVLLKNRADPNITDNYMAGALTHCIHGSDSPDIIRLLLFNCAKLNFADTYGYTPLHHAAAHDRCNTAALLIEAGADVAMAASWQGSAYPKKVDGRHMEAFLERQGWGTRHGGAMTPLHVAAYAGSASTVSVLLEKGKAHVDQRSRRSMTALHFCGQSKHGDYVQTARLLVEHAADVNAVAEGKLRPLHCAAGTGKTALVEYLVEQGAEVGPVTKDGMTPAKLARASGHTVLSSWLEERDSRSALRKMRDGLFK